MNQKTPAEKAHVRPGTSVAVVNSVQEAVQAIGLPTESRFVEVPDAQLVIVFAHKRADLDSLMRPTVAKMAGDAVLWVCFRKGSSAAGLDMSRNDVWAHAEELGLKPLGLVSVNDTWSAFRLKRK